MVLLSTHTPMEQIHTIEDITSQNWFLLQSGIKSKSLSDKNLQVVFNRLYFYSFWYKEKPHLYLMTDNYYYHKSEIYPLLPQSYMTMIHKKMPDRIRYDDPDYMKQYPILSVEEQTITEADIKAAFEALLQNNFKENPITHTILGGCNE